MQQTKDKTVSYPLIGDLSNTQLQSSNDCFIRFFRFTLRDTRELDVNTHRPLFIRKEIGAGGGVWHSKDMSQEDITSAAILDVASDIISCSVSKSKGSSTGNFEIILSSGDVNYHHVLHPGDHCMIWMKRNRVEKIDKNVVNSSNYNNAYNSGFKMYGIISDVRRTFKVNPDGKKMLRYRISGEDFGYFFSSQIYYTAWLSDVLAKYGVALSTIFDNKLIPTITGFSSPVSRKVDDILPLLLSVYLGLGPALNYAASTVLEDVRKELRARGFADRPSVPNDSMLLPSSVGQMFGKESAQTVIDLLYTRIGIEKYPDLSLKPTRKPMEGWKNLTIEAGNQQSLWNILRSYSNPAINEMFIDIKPHPREIEFNLSAKVVRDTGPGYHLYPTFVCRQIPFTSKSASDAFDKKIANGQFDENLTMEATTFLELPRIRVPESFILQEDIGRGNHERYNFLEIYGTNPALKNIDPSSQQAFGNFAIDTPSIHRYGLRTLIAQSDYQYSTKEDKCTSVMLISKWIYLLTDWWLGAHTLESGTFILAGIEEPISLGDNIEIIRQNEVNELYHIEGYQHNYSVGSNGVGEFRTVVQVIRGQRIDEFPVYASGQFDEESGLDIGFSDTEFEGTARPTNSTTSDDSGISPKESPVDRKKASD